MTKKAENFWKGLSHSRTQISPIPPESYGERFLNFITGTTMSKEEGNRQKQSREQGREQGQASSIDTFRSSLGFPRPSMDRATERAEKQTEKQLLKSERTLESDPEPSDRVLRTMSSPSMDGGPSQVTSTLPVVEEVGEGASTGHRGGSQRRATVDPSVLPTGRERTGMVNGDVPHREHDSLPATPYSNPNVNHYRQDNLAPYPHTIDSVTDKGKGKGRATDWETQKNASHLNEKRLPPIPFQPPPPPPPWRGSDSAYVSN
jgi:1-phosphatidylinositol-4-phosphate 5-kinase